MYLGFDIGGTKLRAALFDGDFKPLAQSARLWREFGGGRRQPLDIGAALAAIVVVVDELFQNLEPAQQKIAAVGVGLAGQIETDRQRVRHAPNLGWKNLDFAQALRGAIGQRIGDAPVRLSNDAVAQLSAERHDGAARGHDNILAVYIGTGVGGAFCQGGQLAMGANGQAGEFGHVKIAGANMVCGCGQRGCLETLVGGAYLKIWAEIFAQANGDCDARSEDGAVSLRKIDALALNNLIARDKWAEVSDHLALALANACTLLDPGLLLLGGGVYNNCRQLRNLIKAKIPELTFVGRSAQLQIHDAALGDLAGSLGAVLLALQ